MVASAWAPDAIIDHIFKIAADYHPLGSVADAEEVARAMLFLCSDDAKHITGIDLPVDGGYAMSGPDQGTPRMGRLAE